MRIALAQTNPTVGDISANTRAIADDIERAAQGQAELVVFPELAVIGYPPKDLLLKPAVLDDCQRAIEDLAGLCTKVTAIIGVPARSQKQIGRPLHNAAAICAQGRIQKLQAKSLLPTYDVFDETRYFEPGVNDDLIDLLGRRIGVSICEDLWNDRHVMPRQLYHGNPIDTQARAGAKLLINCAASPFSMGKHAFRLKLMSHAACKHRLPLVYCNQVGGNDELIFDGRSCVVDAGGQIIAQAKAFGTDLLIVDLPDPPCAKDEATSGTGDMAGAPGPVSGSGWADESSRVSEPRRPHASGPSRVADGPDEPDEPDGSDGSDGSDGCEQPGVSSGCGPVLAGQGPHDCDEDESDAVLPMPWVPGGEPAGQQDEQAMLELYQALELGITDYCRKCGFESIVVGLSGGIDSALTAALCVGALGPNQVTGVAMPSRFSSQGSIDDARDLADHLTITLHALAIEPAHQAFEAMLQPVFKDMAPDTTEENIQARIRGVLLMAMSNKFRSLLVTTGNKSELAVGYCTLYGDMAGGLAAISDLPKTLVWALARWINDSPISPLRRRFNRRVIPVSTIEKPPSAELKPDQTDQDSLPPYEQLDQIVQAYVENEQSAAQIARQYQLDQAIVQRVVRLIDFSEYKRRQAAPGLKVTARAFGFGRRMPIAQRYRPYTPPA